MGIRYIHMHHARGPTRRDFPATRPTAMTGGPSRRHWAWIESAQANPPRADIQPGADPVP